MTNGPLLTEAEVGALAGGAMRIGSLFAGIGGFDLAAESLITDALDEGRRDRERLDWLERVACGRASDPMTVAVAFTVKHVGASVYSTLYSATGANLCVALDAARAETGEAP